MPDDNIRLVLVDDEEKRLEVSKLRYRIFVEELGWQIAGARPDNMLDETDEGACIVLAYDGDEPVGTGAIKSWADGPLLPATVADLQLDKFAQHLGREKIALVYKGLVTSSHRKGNVFLRVCAKLFELAVRPPIEFAFLESSPYLLQFYESFGYRRYTSDFSHDGILGVPLVLVLGDHEYLAKIGSSFAGFARERVPSNAASLAYFKEQWSLPEGSANDPGSPIEGLHGAELLDGFTSEDIARFLAVAERMPFQRRDVLVEAGRSDNDLFLVQEGYVEVTISRGTRRIPVATQGPGSFVGEVGLLLGTPRTAIVRALTSGVALRISSAALEQFVESTPVLATRLYRNMSKSLAGRLRDRTLWISQAPPL